MSDELTTLRDELAEAKAELEALRVSAADGAARAAHGESQLAGLREELAQARGEARSREEELAELRERTQSLDGQVRSSAERYRALVLEQTPELPEELVAGGSVEEIDRSLEQARETVAKVRGRLESQALSGRVPVGAPPRTGPDFSGMTTEEKIRYGLDRR